MEAVAALVSVKSRRDPTVKVIVFKGFPGLMGEEGWRALLQGDDMYWSFPPYTMVGESAPWPV